MNRRSQGSLLLSKAITGFLQYKAAEGLSPNTLQSYQRDLKLWQLVESRVGQLRLARGYFYCESCGQCLFPPG